ncbi:MAG TPA: transglycosylase SLT domain-containing protein [Verrucomicrobiae bacterium]|nr:transglycosylase SLT domain-containing protein [Verrucomicrobiae bacterium]
MYQSEDYSGARREFDDAIDEMLEASDLEPADRQDYQRRLDDMVESVHRLDAAGMGNGQADDKQFEKAPLEDILQLTFPVDPKLKNRVREQAAATVSQLPLTVNDAVLGYINFFSNRGRGTLAFATQRSGRYRPMIQRILDEEGVPQELIHLAQAESGFMPRARSSMAAVGMWQFVAFRGAEYGLNRTAYEDDRMDPEKATRAAARHLHDLYNEFGDWYLAIAAYNCGPNVVEDAVARTGYADFWELRSRGVLPAETTNYVPIILAMTIIEKNAAEYGLDLSQMDPPVEYDTVDISASTSLSLISDITDTPLPQLTDLNPALLHATAPQGYALHVPKGTGNMLSAGLEMVPPEHRNAWRMHTLEAGETLASVGKRFGVTPAAIIAANNLKAADAPLGDRLLIPAAPHVDAPARKPSTTYTAAHRTPATTVQRRTVNAVAARPPAAKPATSRPAAVSTKPAPKPASAVSAAAPAVILPSGK